MQLARVIGDVVATRKEPALEGIKLLVIQPIAPDGRTSAGRSSPWIRSAQASASACFSCAARKPAFRFTRRRCRPMPGIVGIVDHWSADGRG